MTIASIAVVGGGQMGQGIAHVAAGAGLKVALIDVSAERAATAVASIQKGLGRLVEKNKMTADDAAALVARITGHGSVSAAATADFVIEAAPENEALKSKLFAELDACVRPGVILASNTSSISITKLAAATQRPDAVIGMHFMNPVPVMKLVEIIRGVLTSDATLQTTLALCAQFGKTTVTARDIPGFIVNRILIPMLNEACFALYEGIGTPADIDTGCKLGLNHPMGPLELADLIGLDTCLAIADVLHRELGDDKYRAAPILRQYVAGGLLGRKTKRGFYQYDDKGARIA